MKQKISQLNENEKAWIKGYLDVAVSFVDTYAPTGNNDPLSLSSMDSAFAAWIATKPTDGVLINDIVNAIGMAFGTKLVDGLGFQWVVASDNQGTEMAVYALPGKGDVLVYPANFVAKRWEKREINFLEPSYQKISEDLARLKQSHTVKAWWKIW
jgi:hypothetical protein